MPPQYVARKKAEYGLKSAALQGLSASATTRRARDEAAVDGVDLAVEMLGIVVRRVRGEHEAERGRGDDDKRNFCRFVHGGTERAAIDAAASNRRPALRAFRDAIRADDRDYALRFITPRCCRACMTAVIRRS